MPDRFEIATKALLDQLPMAAARQIHNGGRVSFGYKPDRVYSVRNFTWVVELESSTSRKGYLGGYLKAQQYIQVECGGRGALLFVINESRCDSETIRNQLKHYHDWLYDLGVPVQPTYLIYAAQLPLMVKNKVPFLSNLFLESAKIVKSDASTDR